MDYDACAEALKKLIKETSHTVCYIRKNYCLMQAIEDYCRSLPIDKNASLNEKAYWFLHQLEDYPICQCRGCTSKVGFRSLKHGYFTACCNSHAQIVARPKTAMTNLERFGSTTPLQSKQIRQKINQHNIEAYGAANVVQSEHFKKKRLETCQKNFGVDYPMQSSEVQKKSRTTCLKAYGHEYALQDESIREKGKITSIQWYGTEYPAQSKPVKERAQKAFQDKYGVDAPAQCPQIRRKQQLRCRYDGIGFDSVHEIAYYIYLVDHRVDFEYQPDASFKYEYGGKAHLYMPDFKVDGQFVEIKGDHFFKEDGTMCNPYDHTQDGLYEAKHKCMLENDVKIIKTSQMKGILDYVAMAYGKSYLKRFRRCSKKVQSLHGI